MNSEHLVTLAGRLAASEITAEEFLRLAAQETRLTDVATVDLDRKERCGFPEVIYGSGKSAEAIVEIAGQLLGSAQRVLVTRLDGEKVKKIQASFPGAIYEEVGRTLRIDPAGDSGSLFGRVAVITAGTSDLPVAEEARAGRPQAWPRGRRGCGRPRVEEAERGG